MLVIEQRLNGRHVGRGIVLRARLIHGVEASGWRMRFSLLKAEVEVQADPGTYAAIARRLRAANVHVKPFRARSIVAPKAVTSPILVNKPVLAQPAILSSTNQMKPLYCQDGGDVKVGTPPCHSPGAILPDLPQPAEDPDRSHGLSKEASALDTQSWLVQQRFGQHASTFANFSGADLLRLSRDDIIQICGLADGIRLYNALHAKRIEPRLTLYVCPAGSAVHSALYLHACRALELRARLRMISCVNLKECDTIVVSGPNGARVRLTDDVVRHLPDNSTYTLERIEENALLLSPTGN